MKKTMGSSRSPLRRLLALTLVFALLLPAGMAGTVGAAESTAAVTEADPARAPESALSIDENTHTLIEYTALDNSKYTKVEIPYGVERISKYAFMNAEFLEKITIPDTVKNIDQYAFTNCIALREITIPGSVDTIGDSAFNNCTALQTVTILYGVHSIGDSAFMGCTSLSKVTVSASVNKFPENETVFYDSGAPDGIRVETNQNDTKTQTGNSAAVDYIKNFSKQENIKVSNLPGNSPAAYAYKKDANGKVTIEGYFGEATAVTVPETINGGKVTQIGAHAFEGNKTIEAVKIPEGVEEIQEGAFKDSRISQVELPETLRTIGSNAFAGCTNLKFVFIPDNVTSIGNDAFDNVTSLTLSGSCKELWKFLRDRRRIRFIPRGAGSSIFHKVKAEVTTTRGAQTNGGTLTEGDPENYFMEDEELTYTVQVNELDAKIGRYEFEGWTITPKMSLEGDPDNAKLLQKILGTSSAEESTLALAKSSITIKVPEVDITLTAKIGFHPAPKRDPDIFEGTWSGDGSQSVILREYVGQGANELKVGTFLFDGKNYVVTKIGQDGYSGGYTHGMAFPNKSTPKIWILDSVDGILPQAFAKATGLKAFGVEGKDDVNGENCVGAHFKTVDGVLFSKDGTKLLAYPASKPGTEYIVPDGVTEIGAYAFYNCKNLTRINTKQVTKIGEYAFSGSENGVSPVKLQEVIMPNVTTIGAHAFEGARSLKSIQFAQSVKDLGKYSFYNCSNLTDIEWAAVNDIERIPAYAFAGCNLSTLTLPNNGTDENTGTVKGIIIDDYAFANCKVKRVTISMSITEMKSNAFAGCSNLEEYCLDTVGGVEIKHPKYACLDGVLFSADMTTLMAYPIAKTTISNVENAKTYQVPDAVVTIGSGAFNKAKFEEIKLGANTAKIESGAFAGSNLKEIDLTKITEISTSVFQACQNLVGVTWPEKVETIKEGSFRDCVSLTRVTAPNVKKIEPFAFYRCAKLTAAPLNDNVTSIGRYAFGYCTSLPEANIPKVIFTQDVTPAKSDECVFYNCTALKAAYVESPDIPVNTFYGCSALETLGLSDKVKNIYSGAFSGCSSLKETVVKKEAAGASEKTENPVVDLSNVNTIAPYAFSSCRSIKNLKTGGTRIDAYAFQGCTGLVTAEIDTQYIMKGALAALGDDCYAFSGCTNLRDLKLSNNVKSIGKLAFSGCNSLTELHIPKNLTALGERAFNNCAKLESVTVDAENTVFEARDGSPAIPAVQPTEENPEGTPAQAAIGSVLYMSSSETNPLTLYLYPQARTGETYTVSDGVDIQNYAFEGAKNLTSVVVGSEASAKPDEKAVDLGAGLFKNCTTLTDFYVYDPEANFGEEVGDGEYLTSLSSMPDTTLQELTVHGWLGSTAERATFVMSRKGVGFMPLESVSDGLIITLEGSAPRYNGTISGYKGTDKSVVVTSLIDEAFMKEYPATELRKDGELYTLETGESVTVKTVGRKAFWADEKTEGFCAEITSIHLPESITAIESYAFDNCAKLTGTFSIPASTERIGPYAFYKCDALLEVRIPESVAVMGGVLKDEIAGMNEPRVGMFKGCGNLRKITVDPRNVNFSSKDGILMSKNGKIIYEAPQGMYVTDYAIPEGVEIIECAAFADNGTISTLTLPSTLKLIKQHAFQRMQLMNIKFTDNTDADKENYLDIDNEAFVDCTMIDKVTLPCRIKRIGADSFKGCTKIQAFEITNNLDYWTYDGVLYHLELDKVSGELEGLGLVCFPMGKAQYEFTIPEKISNPNANKEPKELAVRVIRESAFQGNTIIDKITISKNIEWIFDSAFRDCTCLQEIDWSDRGNEEQYSVTILGMAFSGTALTNFVVPEYVNYLGETSFLNCNALETVEIRNPGLTYGTFDEDYKPDGYHPADRVFGRKDERKLTDEEIENETILDTNFTVRGYSNSTTEDYCKTHGLQFVPINESMAYKIEPRAENGSITVTESAIAGTRVKFYPAPNDQYVLDEKSLRVVAIDGENGGETPVDIEPKENGYYYFEMPAQNVRIEAAFVMKEPYLVTVAVHEKKLVEICPNVSGAYEGATVAIELKNVAAGYQVDEVTANVYTVDENNTHVLGESVVVTPKSNGTYTFTMPAGSVELDAQLSKIDYTVTAEQPIYGELNVDKNKAKVGDIITVTPQITADYGTEYEFAEMCVVCDNGEKYPVSKTNDGKYVFEMPAGNVTVQLKISRLYDITILCGENGNAELSPDRKIAKLGDPVTLIVTPNEGYVSEVTVSEDGNVTRNPIALDFSNSFKMPASDIIINVDFYLKPDTSKDPAAANL